MKVKLSNLFLTVILFVLIFLTMSNTCVSFKPYYANSMNYAGFEAFRQRDGMFSLNAGSGINTPASPDSIFAQITNDSKKESFVGLESATYGADTPIDKFSGTPGNPNCDNISSGLSNSKGGLCLSSDQQMLLRTRGGNASGGDAQIG